jgi:hypothetical protein
MIFFQSKIVPKQRLGRPIEARAISNAVHECENPERSFAWET